MYRTHTCGELNKSSVGKEVTLGGWANRVRNLWWLTFIDLRDRYWITQITIDPKSDFTCEWWKLEDIRAEFVLQIVWEVIARPDNMINKDMATWEIEIKPSKLKIISTCAELPFTIDNENAVGEDLRLEYRYLDLRRKSLRDTMMVRDTLFCNTVSFFHDRNFAYFETPCFTKNTPEWSREFVVPARFDQWKFFVLPQSPQQYKQMLMVAWYDRYIQIARCYRDEDPRWDRQPEFTQVDFEMSFVEEPDVLAIMEEYFKEMTKLFPNKKIKNEKFPFIKWKDAMDKYWSDKPDLRYEWLAFVDVSDWAKKVDFSLLNSAKCVKALVAPKQFSRGEIEKQLEPVIKENWGKWLLYLILDPAEWAKWSLAKYLTDDLKSELLSLTGAKDWETIFFQVGEWTEVVGLLWALRIKLLKELKLTEWMEDLLDFAFVADAPMFELWSDGQLGSTHHPFTKPKDEYIPYLLELAEKMRNGYKLTDEDIEKLTSMESDSYDLVAMWYEIGWWSIRIHDQKLQHAIFTILGLEEKDIQFRFGHILKCFTFWVPPHGWCAFGLDRIVMIFTGKENIREVIAFPKNQKYRDPMFWSPSEIDEQLLSDLGLNIIEKKE